MPRPLSPEARGVLRNVGWLLVGFAAFMLVVTAFLRYPGMLWMDVPMLVLGLAIVAYTFVDERRAAA